MDPVVIIIALVAAAILITAVLAAWCEPYPTYIDSTVIYLKPDPARRMTGREEEGENPDEAPPSRPRTGD